LFFIGLHQAPHNPGELILHLPGKHQVLKQRNVLLHKPDSMIENKEEKANSITHGIGAILFLTAAPFLLAKAHLQGRLLWPSAVFMGCLFMMYANSTFYHSAVSSGIKHRLRIFDHISIFLLIGGTFTPIVVYNMGDWNGLPFLTVFWGVMACGIVFKLFFTGKYKLVSTLIYIGVAWIGAMFSGPLLHNMSRQALIALMIGGVFYTAGTIFYMQKRLLYHHAVWHLFVLAGSMAHFLAVVISIDR
jgi:hemolysin III